MIIIIMIIQFKEFSNNIIMNTRSNKRENQEKEINISLYDKYMMHMTILYDNNKLIINTMSLYMSWIFIHYVSTHIYSNYCTNLSLWGLISSPVIITTPVCRGLSWIIYTGSDKIFNMWNVLGTFILTYVSS